VGCIFVEPNPPLGSRKDAVLALDRPEAEREAGTYGAERAQARTCTVTRTPVLTLRCPRRPSKRVIQRFVQQPPRYLSTSHTDVPATADLLHA
jgi:hypothetical protein